MPQDYYQVLELKPIASKEEIDKAYSPTPNLPL